MFSVAFVSVMRTSAQSYPNLYLIFECFTHFSYQEWTEFLEINYSDNDWSLRDH